MINKSKFIYVNAIPTYKHLVPGIIKYSMPFIANPEEYTGSERSKFIIANLCICITEHKNKYGSFAAGHIDVTWVSGLTGRIWDETAHLDQVIIANGLYSMKL